MAGREGWGGAGRHANIRSQPHDLCKRPDLPDKDEVQVLRVPVTPDNPAASHISCLTHGIHECRQPGQTGAGGMTKAELQVAFVLPLRECPQDMCVLPQHACQGLKELSHSSCCRQGWRRVSAWEPRIVRKTLPVCCPNHHDLHEDA